MVCVRSTELFLDRLQINSVSGKLSKVIEDIMKPFKVEVRGLDEISLDITPLPTTSRRDILYDLSKQYKFFWTQSPTDNIFRFFTIDQTPMGSDYLLDDLSLFSYPGGMVGSAQQAIIDPGEKFILGDIEMMSGIMEIEALPGESVGQFNYYFIDTSLTDYYSKERILASKGMAVPITEDAFKLRDIYPNSLARLRDEKDDLLSGSYIETPSVPKIKSSKKSIGVVNNVIELSPWSTVNGYGMKFPRNLDESITLIGEITKTKSCNLGDVVHDIWNNDGTMFHFRLPTGYMIHEDNNGRVDGTWKIKGNGGVTLAAAGENIILEPSSGVLGNSSGDAVAAKNETCIAVWNGQITLRAPKNAAGTEEISFSLANEIETEGAQLSYIYDDDNYIRHDADPTGGLVEIAAGNSITLISDSIELGSLTASDGVVRKSDLQALINAFNAHTHTTVAGFGPPTQPVPQAAAATASTKVKAD